MKCEDCGGFGYIARFDDKYGATGEDKCEDCKGTGEVEKEESE